MTVLAIGVMCILPCGGSFRDREAYGRKFRQRRSGLLPLANGVPSHDTFCRVLSRPPPGSLVRGLGVWLLAVAGRTDGQAVSFDGKAVRRACERGKDGRAPHVESAWADGAGVCLGQMRVAEKENEIVAIPKLVRRLSLEGAVLTFDATGCQREVAAACRDAGAHDLLPLKDNQPTVNDEVTRFIAPRARRRPEVAHVRRRIARAHRGVENRLHWVVDVVFGEGYCRVRSGFAPENLNAFRKLALTLLRRNGLPGKGVKDMRLECAWDFDRLPVARKHRFVI